MEEQAQVPDRQSEDQAQVTIAERSNVIFTTIFRQTDERRRRIVVSALRHVFPKKFRQIISSIEDRGKRSAPRFPKKLREIDSRLSLQRKPSHRREVDRNLYRNFFVKSTKLQL